jgi:hypothetical protein
MPVTAQNIIYKSLRLLGVLASGEAPSAAESQDSLYSLNSLIDSFAADPQYYYCTQDETFSLSAKSNYCIGNASVDITSLTSVSTTATAVTSQPHSLQTGNSVTVSGASPAAYNVTAQVTVLTPTSFTYTVASTTSPATGTPVFTSGDFYTTRPVRIVGAFTRSASNVDSSLGLITEQYWTNITNKSLSAATPTQVLYRPNSPFGQIIFYPVPTGTLSFHLKSEKMIGAYASLTDTQYLPFGYQRLLELALAVDLAPEYGSRAAPETVAYLKSDLQNIMRTNLAKLPSSKIGAVPNTNVYSDTTLAGSQAMASQMTNAG